MALQLNKTKRNIRILQNIQEGKSIELVAHENKLTIAQIKTILYTDRRRTREQRRKDMIKLKEEGMSYRKIAKIYNVTPQSVASMILQTGKKFIKHKEY